MSRVPRLRWMGIAALAICGLLHAQDEASGSGAFVHVLGFISDDQFVPQTGVTVADGVVVTSWPPLANTGAKGVLRGGTDLEKHWLAADQMREFPQEGVLALSVPGLQMPHVQLALPDLQGDTEVALVAFDTQGSGMASGVLQLGMGTLKISRQTEGSALVAVDIPSAAQASLAGPLMDACGRLVGFVVDDVQGNQRVVASHVLLRLFNDAQIPYELSTSMCLESMPGTQRISPWILWLIWAGIGLLLIVLLAWAWRAIRRRRARALPAPGPVPASDLALIVEADGATSMLKLSWANLQRLDQGAVIGSSPASEIHIEHPTVASGHARLSVRENALWLTELGDSVLVNGQRPMPATPIRLGDGNRLQLGTVVLTVRLGSIPASAD